MRKVKKLSLIQIGTRISIAIIVLLTAQALFIDNLEIWDFFGNDSLIFQILQGTRTNKPHSKYLELKIKLSEDRSLYLAALKLGSNRDEVNLLVDTGSADTLVISSNAHCFIDKRLYNPFDSCFEMGTYDITRSTTASGRIQDFQTKFFGGHFSSGMVIKDQVHLSDNKSISQFKFGIINSTTITNGILGISRTTQSNVDQQYSNFPIALKKSGIVDKIAYSIYLNDLQSENGNILFGGIDNAKYYGKLIFLPFKSPKFSSITVSSIEFANGETVKINQPFLVDSGTTFININDREVYKQIINNFEGRQYNSKYLVDCQQPSNKYFTFHFIGVSIRVPFTDLVTPVYDSTRGEFSKDECLLAITVNPTMPILGANFMRHAYLAFDLERRKLGMAQVKFTSETNIVRFP